MYKIAILSIIFLFVCWLLYNINILEGFQSPSGTTNMVYSSSNCAIVLNSYKLLEDQYNKAIAQDNKQYIETIVSSKNTMKDIIKGMGCDI